MSWLTDLTSKAENLLNKIDQSAATSFQNEDDQSELKIGEINVKQKVESIPPHKIDSNVQTPVGNVASPTRSTASLAGNENNIRDSKKRFNGINDQSNLFRSTSTPSLKKQDDMLFEFLNSNQPVPNKGHIRNLSGPKSSTPRRTSNLLSSESSSLEALNVVTVDGNSQAAEEIQNLKQVEVSSSPLADSTKEMERVAAEETPSMVVSMVDDNHKEQMNDGRLSNLELENNLLKNEMHSLNEELALTVKKLKDYKEESEKYKLRYENRRNQQNEDYDRVRKEYENREVDLNEALKAKDSQLAVLRVRIHDVDTQLESKTKLLSEVQAQNNMMMKDHSDASGVKNVALDNLRMKQVEAERKSIELQQENQKLKADLMNCQSKLVAEQMQYTESIKELQAKHHEGKDKSRDIELKLKSAHDNSQAVQKELNDYKEKAARILQAKEKLILSLKQGTSATDLPPMLISELEETKQEKNLLLDDLQKSRYQLDQLRTEFADLESIHNTESDEKNERVESLQNSLQDEQVKRSHAEEDMKRYMQELQFTRDDLHKTKMSLNTQNQQKDSEIKHLQKQLSVKTTSNPLQEELENRIRTLTDSLIQKQTVVETLSTEKNSLVLQMERLEKQYLDVQSSLTRRKKDAIIDDPEDPESVSRLQPMASIMPKQITQNTRWKKTVNEVDKFSVRLGVFLRRYPIARLMVIAYMFLLHLWSTFVLLTYTPEVHDDQHCNPK